MKQKYFLLVFTALSFVCCNISHAQMVGTVGSPLNNIFLPGHFLEIGQTNIGAFGTNYWSATNPPPAGYHSYGGPFGSGRGIASVYDYGYDGWTTGTPPFFGDYTLPGTPFEGWGIQVGGTGGVNWAFVENSDGAGTASGITGTGSLTGGNTSYVNAGGQLIANWAGTASGGNLTINMQTLLDTNGSQVVVTVVFRNIGTTALNNIYYVRTCDPDNEETRATTPLDPYETTNKIVYQNDIDHRVMVSSKGQEYTNAYMALGTKDCRAKAFIYENWDPGMDDYVTNLANVYSGTATGIDANYTLNYSIYGDYAIGLVYNLGNLAAAGSPGDSAVISYAYIYNGDIGIDSAFPDPVLVVNGAAVPNAAPPLPTIDTFNGCTYTGGNLVSVNVVNATTGDWTWSSWTWSPALGLSSTTGVTNTVNLDVIPNSITYTITGTDSASNGFTCNNKVFYLTVKACNNVTNNNPCAGDTLQFKDKGDSTGATYFWTGPGGFTSTLQNPFIYPSTVANTGEYYVTKTVGSLDTTDSTYATVHYVPVVIDSNNGPICNDGLHTASITATPDSVGESFAWTGPNGYTSGTQNPVITNFPAADAGTYTVVTTTPFGCTSFATTNVMVVNRPVPPPITDPTPYCQYAPFVPFTITLEPGATALWYTADSGGTPNPVAPVVNTSIVGTTTYYASEIIGSCESFRDSISVVVIHTPAAPAVTGPMVYCQYIGPFVPLTVTTEPGGIAYWVTSSGNTTIEPAVNISYAGSYPYSVFQTDSSCPGPVTTGTISVNPKPVPPVFTPPIYCQYLSSAPIAATGSAGGLLTWYGPGIPATGTMAIPSPAPSTAVPGVFDYYVTQSVTTNGMTCISDTVLDTVTILPQPAPPITVDLSYCQYDSTLPLTAIGRGLQWYYGGFLIDSTPVPPTNYVPAGNYENVTTWYVTQSVDSLGVTCQSDSASLSVATFYLPVFNITPSAPFVCQYDSINLAFTGQSLYEPDYTWVLPEGAKVVDGTFLTGTPSIVVQFDSANQNNYVYLTASDDSGKCSTKDTIRINVVAHPSATAYTNPNVCIDDTTALSLSYSSPSAAEFIWRIDGTLLNSTGELNIVYSNSNSGGPYSISWNDSGTHIIQLNTYTAEGCASFPSYDTVQVHGLPNASFTYKTRDASMCIEDSVLFIASVDDHSYLYTWSPAHAFNNINTPSSWGRVESNPSVITLNVTDAYGCSSTSSLTLEPGSCCTVGFPNAFTPNDDGKNDIFRPIFPDTSFHTFHEFRIANRWGQTIFESANSSPRWDGTYNGIPQDMGVYYYYIKFDCGGNTVIQKGDVTLIR